MCHTRDSEGRWTCHISESDDSDDSDIRGGMPVGGEGALGGEGDDRDGAVGRRVPPHPSFLPDTGRHAAHDHGACRRDQTRTSRHAQSRAVTAHDHGARSRRTITAHDTGVVGAHRLTRRALSLHIARASAVQTTPAGGPGTNPGCVPTFNGDVAKDVSRGERGREIGRDLGRQGT